MTSFVGAEYVIASMLIEKVRKGVHSVTLKELGTYGINVQRRANDNDIDAVFLTSRVQLYNAIYDFSDYFKCNYTDLNELVSITLTDTTDIKDLEYRFIGYIPDEIYNVLQSVAKEVA